MTHQTVAWLWVGEEHGEAGGWPTHFRGTSTVIGVAEDAGRVQKVWPGGGIRVPCPL